MKPRSGSSKRQMKQLSESLHHRLNAYALAASAAGVGVLALVQPAEGKIVWTKVHRNLRSGIFLDFNHDGVVDFGIPIHTTQTESSRHLSSLSVVVYRSQSRNRIVGASDREASALHAGARIASAQQARGQMVFVEQQRGEKTHFYGQWANGGKGVKDRYLGLKFYINGEAHYGWARLSVWFRQQRIEGVLTGYAYETIPNKPIIAGKTHGAGDAEQAASASLTIPAQKPASLGALALGSPGLSIWRREESAGATP